MKPILILVVILAVAAGLYVAFRGAATEPAKSPPQGQGPSPGIVDAISNQLDFKARAGTGVKIEAMRTDLKQLLAQGQPDADAVKDTLGRYGDLEAEVAGAKQELATRGTSQKDIDAWLTKFHWGEVQDLASQLRSHAPAQ
jgi:hypothetical protein